MEHHCGDNGHVTERRKKTRPVTSDRRKRRRSASAAPAERLKPSGPALERRSEVRERLTVKLPRRILDRLRNAVYYTPKLTVAGLIEKAITLFVDRMEHDRGETFPRRKSDLRPGRPRTVIDE